MKNKPQPKTISKSKNSTEKLSLKKDGLILAAILAITLFLFAPTFNFSFVNWDDDVNLTNNPNVTQLNKQTINNIFTETVIGGYTPLTTLSFALEYISVGLKPGPYHVHNVILHLICVFLVYILMRQIGMNLFISGLTALLFGIQPMRVESVAWVTERKDVLYSVFFLASTICYIAYRKSKNLFYYFISIFLFILSLLSKIQAVSLPLALIAIDYLMDKRLNRKLLWNKIPFLVLSIITGLVGIYFLKQQGSLEIGTVLPFYQRIFIGSYTLVIYMIKSVVPFELSAIYPFPAKLTLLHYASLPFVIFIGFVVWKIKKYRTEIIFGMLFFVFNVVFMLQVVGAGQGYQADRFTYIPYIGLFFIIAFISNSLLTNKLKAVIWASVLIYTFILAGTTYKRVKVWENSETLFEDVILKYPKVAVAHNNMGRYFRELNQYDKAIASYTKAIEIDPKGYKTYSNRGKAYFDTGKADEALIDLNKCLEIEPDYAEALSNRGAVLASKNKFKEAITDLNKAIKLDPTNVNALSNRSLAYYYTKYFELSANDVTTYLKFKPDDADMINIRALCFLNLKKYKESLADFNRSIELKPGQGIFYQNRSTYYNSVSDKQHALEDILKAQQLGVNVNPDYIKFLQSK
jgi:tetratricopeptide (TPR) repeat protein